MKRENFQELCTQIAAGKNQEYSEDIFRAVSEHYSGRARKLPVIWLETCDSGDNNIAFMNTTYPYMGRVFDEMVDLLYSNTFMAAQGKDALAILRSAAERFKGKFTLVVEGAIPIKDNGIFTVIARTLSYNITAWEAVGWLGELAQYVIALGTCASFGGVSAARPNISGSVGVRDVVNREVINLSGCPINPDWFVGTLAHLLMYGLPELDELSRPKLFYEFTVHRHCQRRSYFDKKEYAENLGDIQCMFSQGCMGPRTNADCPYRQWINHVSWPVKVNTPCIGCTNKDFPDGSAPFFSPLPNKTETKQEPDLKEQMKGAEK